MIDAGWVAVADDPDYDNTVARVTDHVRRFALTMWVTDCYTEALYFARRSYQFLTFNKAGSQSLLTEIRGENPRIQSCN
jgi:hypothetical protein